MSNNNDYESINTIVGILNSKASASESLESLKNSSEVAELKMSLKDSTKASFELTKDKFAINFNDNKMIISDDSVEINFLKITNQ